MKIILRLMGGGLYLLSLFFVTVTAQPPSTSFLRCDANGCYLAIKPSPPIAAGPNAIKLITASVFQSGKKVDVDIAGADNFGADFTLRIKDPDVLKGNFKPLMVAVHSYPTVSGGQSGFLMTATSELAASLKTNTPYCGLALAVLKADQAQTSEYIQQRSKDIAEYIKNTRPSVRIESLSEKGTQPRMIQDVRFYGGAGTNQPDQFFACLAFTPPMPSGTYHLELSFPSEAPIELRNPILKLNLTNAAHAEAPLSVNASKVGQRSLENNLDLGLQFASDVTEKEIKDSTGKVIGKERVRDNVGTLDLRFAPFLNILPIDTKNNRLFFLTPFYIDAKVATGPVNKSTLSLNRIVVGSDFEIRNYTNPTTYPTYQRHIFRFRHASDRDFKQTEWKAGYEFQPVFSRWNRPLRWKRDTEDPILDPDPNNAPKDIATRIGFGWQVLPLMGAELGRTERSLRPFAALELEKTVRRLYLGTTINLDLTSYVTLSATSILYIRGEKRDDRLHNYFIGTASVPLPSFSVDAAHSLFFSFERGGQPPFATPDVNALRFGYRVQWDGWFRQFR